MNAVDLKELKEAAERAMPDDNWGRARLYDSISDREAAAFIALANPSTILSLIERVEAVEGMLATAREAINSCDIGAFGWGDAGGLSDVYPIKDELLSNIDATLTQTPASNPMGSGE
jgi:hypothetical protein